MAAPESRLHAMLVSWLDANSTLTYQDQTTLGSLWTLWRNGAPYDSYAINKLLQAIKAFYGPCMSQHDIVITYGEFTPGGDLQTVGNLDDCLAVCQ